MDEAAALAERWVTVAAIAPESLQDAALASFTSFDPDGEHWRAEHLDAGITLLTPSLAKGLEFDAVVVVEPAGVIAKELHGYRMLYIALTLAVPGARRRSRRGASQGDFPATHRLRDAGQ
jgi:superfamily I DNA/RNA helicase